MKVPLAWTAAAALVVTIVVAVALLVSDRRETFEEKAYGRAKSTIDAVEAPLSGALSQPVRWTESGVSGIRGYFFAVSENRKLRKQNAELAGWRDTALALRNTNDRYKALLGLKTDPPVPMATGRAVTDSRGPFANSRLINVGIEAGVKVGNPVMSENGLVGRIVGTTTGASRVLLLTDVASRTPVMVDRTNARAILTGDGGPNPVLVYLRGRDPVKLGDRIVTSGDGGVFPRGLPVGIAVKALNGDWRVQLASDYAPIDFVRVLMFEDFSRLVSEKALAVSQMPAPPPGLNVQTLPTAPAVQPLGAPGTAGAAALTTPAAPSGKAAVPPTVPTAKPPPPATTAPNAPAPKTPALKMPAPKTTPAIAAPKTVTAAPKTATSNSPAPKAEAIKPSVQTPKIQTPPVTSAAAAKPAGATPNGPAPALKTTTPAANASTPRSIGALLATTPASPATKIVPATKTAKPPRKPGEYAKPPANFKPPTNAPVSAMQPIP